MAYRAFTAHTEVIIAYFKQTSTKFKKIIKFLLHYVTKQKTPPLILSVEGFSNTMFTYRFSNSYVEK